MNFMIDIINTERRCKIIAIEDPVEYVHRQKKRSLFSRNYTQM
jgi:twitching motility protein PilT